MASLWIVPSILRRTNKFLKNSLKRKKKIEENTQLIAWGQYYPDFKIIQGFHNKIKSYTSISYEYRRRNPQQKY